MKHPIAKERIKKLVGKVLPEVVELRHALHSIPENGLEERQTAEKIRAFVKRTNLEVLPPLIETDTVGLLHGSKPGRNVTLRADIDALPVQETSGVSWASRHPGFSHACGHDGHSAILCGVLLVLDELMGSIPGSVRFVFQPAEEKAGGGKKLVEKGLLDMDPKPDAVFALHGWSGIPLGALTAHPGAMMAAADRFVITVKGRGGHAARPHGTVDPIVVSAQVILGLQSVVSRNVSPVEPAVVSVCTVRGGTADNAIPDEVRMEGTTRYMKAELKELIERRMTQVISGICESAGASYEFVYDPGYIPLVNDPDMTTFTRSVIRDYMGEAAWLDGHPPTMGAEDFSYFLQKVPGVFMQLGLGKDHAPIHTSRFDFDDRALEHGIMALTAITLEVLASFT
jgi:amidohydrolase